MNPLYWYQSKAGTGTQKVSVLAVVGYVRSSVLKVIADGFFGSFQVRFDKDNNLSLSLWLDAVNGSCC